MWAASLSRRIQLQRFGQVLLASEVVAPPPGTQGGTRTHKNLFLRQAPMPIRLLVHMKNTAEHPIGALSPCGTSIV